MSYAEDKGPLSGLLSFPASAYLEKFNSLVAASSAFHSPAMVLYVGFLFKIQHGLQNLAVVLK